MMTAADPVAQVARNGSILIVSRLVSMAAGVVTLPVLFGGLGEHAFGVWVLLNGLVGLLGYVDLGLGSAQIREVARSVETGRRRRARAVLMMGTCWSAGFGGLALVLGALSWPFIAAVLPHSDPQASPFVLILLSFWIGGMAVPWRAVLEGMQCYLVLTGIECGAAILATVISAGVVLAGGGLTALAAASAVIAVIRTIAVAVLAHCRMPTLSPSLFRWRWSDVTATLRYGLPVQATNLAMAVNLETDRLVLGAFAGPSMVAAYEPGSRVANLFRLPASLVLVAAFPAVSQVAASGGRDRLDQIYVHMTRYLAMFAAAGGAALVVCADPLIRLWLGQPVPLAATTLALLSVGGIASLPVGAASVIARAEGKPELEARYAAVAAALNLLLTIPLLKVLGPWGIPLSTAVAGAVASGYFLLHFHRRSERPRWPAVRALAPPGLAAVMATSLLLALADSLPDGSTRADAALAVLCRGGLAVLVVIAVLVAVRYIDWTDLARLGTVLRWQRPRRGTVLATEGQSR